MQGAFYGVGAAVIAIVGRSAYKLTRTTLGKDYLLWGIFAVAAGVTAWTESEIISLFFIAGTLALVFRAFVHRSTPHVLPLLAVFPPWLLTGLHGPAPR